MTLNHQGIIKIEKEDKSASIQVVFIDAMDIIASMNNYLSLFSVISFGML